MNIQDDTTQTSASVKTNEDLTRENTQIPQAKDIPEAEVKQAVPDEPKSEADEWKEKYVRALADYQNLEKRVQSERDGLRKYANEMLFRELLPLITVLEQAEAHVKDTGLTLALKQIKDFLVKQGVTRVHTTGKIFDPHTMECIEIVKGEKDNTVLKEVMPGYEMNGHVIQIAKVVVGSKAGSGSKNESVDTGVDAGAAK